MIALSFPLATWRALLYLVAIVGFVAALKGLSSPRGARRANLLGASAALLAVGITFSDPAVYHTPLNVALAGVAMAVGAAVAVPAARLVKMTAMPQMVAAFNGVGGAAAALISVVEWLHWHSVGVHPATYQIVEVLLGVLIGSVSFSGSAVAFAKLQELMATRPITYPAQQAINAAAGIATIALTLTAVATGTVGYVYVIGALALGLGVALVLPIGGADVPVLISLLNSFTGLAVAASGFTLDNNLLIVAGTLVGANVNVIQMVIGSSMDR
jgi:NAD(P) transhydrogenase subunit beta